MFAMIAVAQPSQWLRAKSPSGSTQAIGRKRHMVIFLGFLAPADQRGKKTWCMFFFFSPGEKETKRHVFCTKMWFGYVVSFKGKKLLVSMLGQVQPLEICVFL